MFNCSLFAVDVPRQNGTAIELLSNNADDGVDFTEQRNNVLSPSDSGSDKTIAEQPHLVAVTMNDTAERPSHCENEIAPFNNCVDNGERHNDALSTNDRTIAEHHKLDAVTSNDIFGVDASGQPHPDEFSGGFQQENSVAENVETDPRSNEKRKKPNRKNAIASQKRSKSANRQRY